MHDAVKVSIGLQFVAGLMADGTVTIRTTILDDSEYAGRNYCRDRERKNGQSTPTNLGGK